LSFKTELDEDIGKVFLNSDEYAVQVLVTPNGGSPAPYNIDGIFDEAYEVVDPGSEAEISSISPVLQVKSTATTLLIVQKDVIRINGTDYQVTDTQTDGVGIITIILNLVG